MSENGLHKIPAMRTALEAIQELHKPIPMAPGLEETPVCDGCENPGRFVYWPCPTRRLADQGLGGGERG